MGKIGGLALVAVLALTGCAAAHAESLPTSRATVQPARVAQATRVGIYKAMPDTEFADVQRGLCQHFAAGYTVDDAVRVQAELFGPEAASEMRTVAQSVKDAGC